MGTPTDEELIAWSNDDEVTVEENDTVDAYDTKETSDDVDEPIINDDVEDDDSDIVDDSTDEDDDVEYDEDGDDSNEEEVAEDTITVKVNGEEIEVTQDELIKSYSKGQAADDKWREADAKNQQAQRFVEMMKTDPIGVMHQMGIDTRKVTEEHLASLLNYENMDEDQRNQFDTQVENQRLKAENEQINGVQRQQQMQEASAQLSIDIPEALESMDIPVTDWSFKRLATHMHDAMSHPDVNIRNTPIERLAELVKEDYEEEIGLMSADQKKKVLGSKAAKEQHKKDVKKLKSNQLKRSKNPVKGSRKGRHVEKMDSTDFNDYLDSIT